MSKASDILKRLQEADFDDDDMGLLHSAMSRIGNDALFKVGDAVKVRPDWQRILLKPERFSWFFKDRLNIAVESDAVAFVRKVVGVKLDQIPIRHDSFGDKATIEIDFGNLFNGKFSKHMPTDGIMRVPSSILELE